MILTKMTGRAVLLVACCVASSHALASFSDSGTLTKGSAVICRGGGINIAFGGGFDNGVHSTYGTYSPTGVAGGETVKGIFEMRGAGTCAPFAGTYLVISGFSSNPGSMWLNSITCNGVQLSQGTSGFSYNSGTASWGWTNGFGLYNLSEGAQVSCTIVHN